TTRTGQLLTNLIAHLNGVDASGQPWAGMEMFFSKRVRADDVRMEKVYEHFQDNLEDILKITHRSGAQTIVCSLADNLQGIAPFASLHKPSLSTTEEKKWNELYQSGIASEAAGDDSAALQEFKAASA